MIRLGTRGSALAMVQAEVVATALRALGATVEIVPMRTEGDRIQDRSLADVGGKGLFVREIEAALLRNDVDIAVHSLKDLPADLPGGLTMAAYPEREDPRDVLVTREDTDIARLAPGSVIGTSSPRRRVLLLAMRSDVRIEPIRGNVDTRLRKLAERSFDAIVLAAAGLNRLGLRVAHLTPLDPEVFVPAVGQGIVGVETREDDAETRRWVGQLDHPATRTRATAERAFLARLGASCVTPMAAHARLSGATIVVDGVVASDDGREILRDTAMGPSERAAEIGRSLAEALLERGAASITPLRPVGR